MKRRALALALLLVGCRDSDALRGEAGSMQAPVAESVSAAPPLFPVDASLPPPPRCQLVTKDAPADVAFGTGAELGEVVPFGGGFAFGALRSSDAGRQASVLRVGGAAPPSQTDLGASWGDAPPPQPFVRGEGLFVVAYVRPIGRRLPPSPSGERSTRQLSVHHVGAPDAPVELPPESDGSAAYDVAAAAGPGSIGAVIAWDDIGRGATPAASLSVIELATLTSDAKALGRVRTLPAVSEDGVPTSASDPRLVARPNGYWLTWLARRPERPVAPLPLPAGEIETPSEEATFGWVEALSLDGDGAPVGTAHPLTAKTGHVGNYGIAAHDGALVVVAEDEGATVRRGGGSLLQVVWRGEGVADVQHLVHGGVEEGTPPTLIEGEKAELWLSYLDVQGDAELVPLVLGPSATHPTPSTEPLLSKGRTLGLAGVTGTEHEPRWGLAMQEGAGWSLRWATCTSSLRPSSPSGSPAPSASAAGPAKQ